ncbi:hypothetical protein ABT072_28570 [Streptomyces sp. NPDC002589]|uniref:hypothetical protein n=1 Tax=Streptomyces sp. NPDC002589 TaxID=3154420 RepID=UPI00331F956A
MATWPLGLLLPAEDTDVVPADGFCGAAEFPGEDPAHAAVAPSIPEQSVTATARRMMFHTFLRGLIAVIRKIGTPRDAGCGWHVVAAFVAEKDWPPGIPRRLDC